MPNKQLWFAVAVQPVDKGIEQPEQLLKTAVNPYRNLADSRPQILLGREWFWENVRRESSIKETILIKSSIRLVRTN